MMPHMFMMGSKQYNGKNTQQRSKMEETDSDRICRPQQYGDEVQYERQRQSSDSRLTKEFSPNEFSPITQLFSTMVNHIWVML